VIRMVIRLLMLLSLPRSLQIPESELRNIGEVDDHYSIGLDAANLITMAHADRASRRLACQTNGPRYGPKVVRNNVRNCG
jgi:hypothetical protein